MNEINLDLLIGREVIGADGRELGRIEEVLGATQEGELVVTDYLIGARGFLRRFGITSLGLFGVRLHKPKRIPWRSMDLSDPEHPRTTERLDDLKEWNGD